jgi:predicted RND superfamily exporter protein
LSADFLRRWRAVILAVAVAAAAWLGSHAARVGIEHDNESLHTTDATSLRVAADFRAAFGSDEDLFVAIGHPRLLHSEGLSLLADATARIAAMDGVRHAWSLTNADELVAGAAGAEPRPLLSPPWDAPGLHQRAIAAVERNPDLTGWLVSADRTGAGIVVELEERTGDTLYRSRLVEALRSLAPVVAAGGGELHLAGVPVQKIDVSASVDRDQRVLLPAAVAVLGLVLAVFFRHASGVLVPLGAAGLTVACTVGAYGATGHSIHAITALLPPVLLVVALATTVHVYDAWLAGHGDGSGPVGADRAGPGGPDRASAAVRAVLVPAVLCAVTTAQGFGSLMIGVDLPAVRQFGLFAALGTGIAFVVATMVVPAVLSFLRPPPHRVSDEHGLTLRFLDATAHLSTTRPRAVLLAFGVVTALLATGIPLLRTNTDLVGFLRADSLLRVDTAWIDEHLTGTLPLEFLVRRRDGRPLADAGTFARLEKLEEAVKACDHVSGATSLVALVRQVHRADSGGAVLALPADDARLQQELDLLDESGHAMVRRFASPGMTALRLSVRLHAVGSAESSPLVESMREDAARILGKDIEVLPTGPLWQIVRDSDNLVRQQVWSFGSAIVLVVAAIGLLMRSWAFTLVAMIPNVMPIVWTGGLMGWLGIELSTGTVMIASAVLGLVVDDTIHYLSHYRRVVGGDPVQAILATTRAVGAPVTVASVSLVLGFWVGALGSFQPTVHFSLLTGLTMITGLVCDLLVLPATLVLLGACRRDGAD